MFAEQLCQLGFYLISSSFSGCSANSEEDRPHGRQAPEVQILSFRPF
jgi:hypothetical protein